MEALLAAVVDFVSAHRAWAPYLAFVFAFGETIAFVSILIPSTAILVAVGGLVATGGLDLTPIWLGASIGALVGSTLSFWLGRRFGPVLLRSWPFTRHPELVQKGTDAFARWGATAVFIGHFFGPLRSVVFVMGGVSQMRWAPFMLANVPGALIWAYAIPKSGEIGGNVIGYLWRALFGA